MNDVDGRQNTEKAAIFRCFSIDVINNITTTRVQVTKKQPELEGAFTAFQMVFFRCFSVYMCSKSMWIVNINVLKLLVYLSYFSLLFHFCVIFEMAVFHFLSVICLFRQPNPVTCIRFKLFFSSSCWFYFESRQQKKKWHINTWQEKKEEAQWFLCMINGHLCCDWRILNFGSFAHSKNGQKMSW